MNNFSIHPSQTKNNIFKNPSRLRFEALQIKNTGIIFIGGMFRHYTLCARKGCGGEIFWLPRNHIYTN